MIDWSLPCPSIFGRKKPLSANTLRRIEAGLKKYGGPMAEAFILAMNYMSSGEHDNRYVRDLDDPLATVTSQGNRFALVQLTHGGRELDPSSPLPTVTGANRGEIGLAQAMLVSAGGPEVNARPVDSPMNTVLTRDHMGLVQPFIVPQFSEQSPRDTEQPLGTITTTSRGIGLATPFIVPTNYGERQGQSPRTHDAGDPLPTVVGTSSHGVAQPFIVRYNRTSGAQSIDSPLSTADTHDRLGLIAPDVVRLDIGFRMLQPHELAAAMGFPAGYQFSGNRGDQVKQIGNAVEVNQAYALTMAILGAIR